MIEKTYTIRKTVETKDTPVSDMVAFRLTTYINDKKESVSEGFTSRESLEKWDGIQPLDGYYSSECMYPKLVQKSFWEKYRTEYVDHPQMFFSERSYTDLENPNFELVFYDSPSENYFHLDQKTAFPKYMQIDYIDGSINEKVYDLDLLKKLVDACPNASTKGVTWIPHYNVEDPDNGPFHTLSIEVFPTEDQYNEAIQEDYFYRRRRMLSILGFDEAKRADT